MDTILGVFLTLQGCYLALANPDPFYVWPLSPGYPPGEIIANSSAGSAHCIQGSDGHPNLDYNALKLQGCVNSYVDVTLVTTKTIRDFSMIIFASPEGFNGTFFHYAKQVQTGSSNEIINIVLSYENITISLYITDGSNNILNMVSLVANFQDGAFLPILIVFDPTSHDNVKVMYLYAGTDVTRIKMFVDDKILGLPGKIRIGGSFNNGYNSYHGRVTCLQFYDAKISSADYDAALNRCMSTLWPSYFGEQSSDQQTTTGKGYFHLISRGQMPQSYIIPVASFNSSSKVKCASSCTLPSNECVSFAFNKLQKICHLFDLDYTSSLITETMTDYYVVGCCN